LKFLFRKIVSSQSQKGKSKETRPPANNKTKKRQKAATPANVASSNSHLPNQKSDPYTMSVEAEIPIQPQRSNVAAGNLLFSLSRDLIIVLWSIIAIQAYQGQPFYMGMLSLVAEAWEVYRRRSQPPNVMPRRSTVEQFWRATAWVPAAWMWSLVAIAVVDEDDYDGSEFVTATLKAGTWTYVRHCMSIQHWQVLKSVLSSVTRLFFLGGVFVLCFFQELSERPFVIALGCDTVMRIGSSTYDYFVERQALWEAKVEACQDLVWAALHTRRGEEIDTADLYDIVCRDNPHLCQNLYQVWFELEQRAARDKHIIAVTHGPTTGSTQWCWGEMGKDQDE
jgi:hypothetical protein